MFSFLKSQQKDSVSIQDIDNLLGKIALIDIREPYEFSNAHIEGAINIPMGELLRDPEQFLEEGQQYYLMCQSGNRSGRAVHALRAQGFDVLNVSGGIGAYRGAYRK